MRWLSKQPLLVLLRGVSTISDSLRREKLKLAFSSVILIYLMDLASASHRNRGQGCMKGKTETIIVNAMRDGIIEETDYEADFNFKQVSKYV